MGQILITEGMINADTIKTYLGAYLMILLCVLSFNYIDIYMRISKDKKV